MDKKNEDYVVRMPEDAFGKGEKDPFIARSPSRRSHNGSPVGIAQPFSKLDNSPGLSIMSYCLSSISMTVVNKYVVSGSFWNLNFFYLAIQVSLATHRPNVGIILIFSMCRLSFVSWRSPHASKPVSLRSWPPSIPIERRSVCGDITINDELPPDADGVQGSRSRFCWSA